MDDAGTLLSFFCHFNLLSSHVDDHSLSVTSYGNNISAQQSKKQFQYCSALGLLLEVICKNTKRTLHVLICYANTYTAFTFPVPCADYRGTLQAPCLKDHASTTKYQTKFPDQPYKKPSFQLQNPVMCLKIEDRKR